MGRRVRNAWHSASGVAVGVGAIGTHAKQITAQSNSTTTKIIHITLRSSQFILYLLSPLLRHRLCDSNKRA
jgi:hypothetical protein